MRTLSTDEMRAASGGTVAGVIGSMYHKDAHTGPGGLYYDGGGDPFAQGTLYTTYENARLELGGHDPLAVIGQLLEQKVNPCGEIATEYYNQNPDPSDTAAFMWDLLRDELGGENWNHWEEFIMQEYISCLESALVSEGYNMSPGNSIDP